MSSTVVRENSCDQPTDDWLVKGCRICGAATFEL